MSGKAKKTLYAVISFILLVVAFAGAVWMWYASGEHAVLLLAVALCFVLLPINVIVHECGHLLFGLALGMKFVSVRVGNLNFSKQNGKLKVRFVWSGDSAGESKFFPKRVEELRGRFLMTTLGGAIFNFIYAAALLTLYFVLPHNPVLLFFAMFAPISAYEGITALYPVELPAGRTDGSVAVGIFKKEPDVAVMFTILTAQAILYRGSFSQIPETVLFDTPVVREDLPAFWALLQLRVQYLLAAGREEEAEKVFSRLAALAEYFPDEFSEEVARYEEYFAGSFEGEETPFFGINELEEQLATKCAEK